MRRLLAVTAAMLVGLSILAPNASAGEFLGPSGRYPRGPPTRVGRTHFLTPSTVRYNLIGYGVDMEYRQDDVTRAYCPACARELASVSDSGRGFCEEHGWQAGEWTQRTEPPVDEIVTEGHPLLGAR